MYKVLEMFTDLHDNNYKYEVGDEYPRLGLKPSLARINELCGAENRRGHAVIEEVEDLPFGDDAVTSEDTKEPQEEPKAEKPKAKRGGRKTK